MPRSHNSGSILTNGGPRRLGLLGGGTVSGLTLTATKVGVDEAPQGVHFVATPLGVSNPADVVVLWDFNDTYQFRYLPETTKANDRQSGTAIGHRVGHDYKEAGTYNPTATAYQFVNGQYVASVSQSVEVVIAAEDLAFTETVCISKTGSFTGAPVGATQVLWSSLITGGVATATYSIGEGKRLLFEAGQTYEWETGVTAFGTGWTVLDTVNPPVKLGRFGSGSNPRILANGAFTIPNPRVGKLSVVDVDLVGEYDCTANLDWEDTGVYPTPPPQPNAMLYLMGFSTVPGVIAEYYVSGCSISGGYINVQVTGSGQARAFISDNYVSNWANFGVYGFGTEAACIVGNRIEQGLVSVDPVAGNPAQRAWNSAGRPNTPRHGPVRVEGGRNYAINHNFIRSYRSGWSTSPGTDGVSAIQSAVRLTTTAFPDDVNSFTVSQNDLIGGLGVISATSTDFSGGPAQGRVVCGVIESNYMAPDSGRTAGFFAVSFPNLQVRTNVAHWPASEPLVTSAIPSTRNFQASPGTTGTFPGTINFYSNTMVFDGDLPTINWVQTTESAPGDANSTQFTFENQIIQMRGAYNEATTADFYKTDFDPLEVDFPFYPKFGSLAYGGYSEGRLPALTFDGTVRTAPFGLGAGEESGEPVVTVTINEVEIFGGDVLGTDVTETGTIVFAGSGTPITGGDITYSWLVNETERANGFTVTGGDVVRARAAFTHASGAQVVLSAPIFAQSGPVFAPTLTGTPTILASWDFNNPATLAINGTEISSVAGTDGTSIALAQGTASRRPDITLVGDKKAALFNRLDSQFLQAVNGLSSMRPMSLVVIAQPIGTASTLTTETILEVAKRSGNGARDRTNIALLKWNDNSNSGWIATNANGTNTTPAREPFRITEALRLAVSTQNGVGSAPNLYLDGTATPITGATATGTVTSFTHITMGAATVSNNEAGFLDAYVFRAIIYDGVLNATQIEEVAVWAATNYGTPNNA